MDWIISISLIAAFAIAWAWLVYASDKAIEEGKDNWHEKN